MMSHAAPPRATQAMPAIQAGQRPIDVYLRSGDYVVRDHRHRIRTLLGSCVSITLWHPRCRVGAMSHFLLWGRGRPGPAGELDGRYGEDALQLMLRGLRALGVDGRACEAKIFGGGDMFPNRSSHGMPGVGRRNGEAARDLLEAQDIAVRSESLFGEGYRKIIFDVSSGHVWSCQVRPARE